MKETLVERPKAKSRGRNVVTKAKPKAKPKAKAKAKAKVQPQSSRFGENLGAWAAYLQNERADSETSTESVVWRAVEALVGVTDADGCSVSLADWGIELMTERVNGEFVRKTHLRDTMASRGTLGHTAMRTGLPQSVRRWRQDTFHHYPEPVRRGRFESATCFPLGGRGGSLGVLTFYFQSPREMDKRERELGVILAQSTALTIDNSLLLSEGRQNTLVTVQALIRSLEAKDSETSYHSLRVTQHATVLAEQMGLADEDVRNVQFGATLHDLGKIGIIGTVLNKRGKLTDDEYAIVRKHPVIGARIVETVDFLAGAVPIIRHHHEAWDGTGYPDRLAGPEIPLGARVVAVPDFYDALTSHRPYRAAYSHEHALDMVEERIGSIFDPEIARLFLEIQRNRKIAASDA